jgi:flagellar biosynthetic protein FliS
MSTQYAVNRYSTAEMTYGNPIRTVITAYDLIVKLLRKAKKNLDENDVANKCICIQKASELVHTLQDGLDFENGGNFVHSLDKFYLGMFFKINNLIIKNQGHAEIDDIVDTIKKVQAKWEELLEQSYVVSEEDKNLTYASVKC